MEPVSCVIEIVTTPIAVGAVYDQLMDHGSGACVVFVGRVRDTNDGQSARGILYEAYEAMAIAECERIWVEACAQWPLRGGTILHRIGALVVGDASVVVGVVAPHRQEAFAAARFLIDQLKRRAPIWKKETYHEGPSAWIANTP